MNGWMGWEVAGYVDRLEREAIATEFFWIVLPVWPRRRSSYLFRTAEGEPAHFEIPRDRRSLVLGYLRTPIWMTALIIGAGGVARISWPLLAISAVLGALAAYLTFRVGRLDLNERERRQLLRRVTGIGAPPELMPRMMREHARDELAESWFHERGVGWRSAITSGVASEVLVAIAEYDQAAKLAIRARTNLYDAEGN
jgi:hypothetical protein